jgi:hypothetical protein
MNAVPTRLGLVLALSAPTLCAQEPIELTAELLSAIAGDALPNVRAATGAALARGVEMRLATEQEIHELLVLENLPVVRNQVEDEERARAGARELADLLAPALLAKLALGQGTILVNPAAVRGNSRLLGVPELATLAGLRAVLVHELVHAADDESFELSKLYASRADAESVEALNALVEGHAQHVARAVCGELGWSDGFSVFTRAIGAPAQKAVDGGAGAELVGRPLASYFSAAYYDGERFVDALVLAGGAAAVAQAFRDPPRELALIHNPDWYLRPERRPALAFDLERALDAFRDDFPAPEWVIRRSALLPTQLDVALTFLPAEDRERIKRTMRQARVLSGTHAQNPGERFLAIGIEEFATLEDAAFYLDGFLREQRARDEAMKEGAIQILEARYEPLSAPRPSGVLVWKRIGLAGIVSEVRSVCVRSGTLAIEVLAANEPDIGDEDVLLLVRRALDAALKSPHATQAPTPEAPAGESRSDGNGGG